MGLRCAWHLPQAHFKCNFLLLKFGIEFASFFVLVNFELVCLFLILNTIFEHIYKKYKYLKWRFYNIETK